VNKSIPHLNPFNFFWPNDPNFHLKSYYKSQGRVFSICAIKTPPQRPWICFVSSNICSKSIKSCILVFFQLLLHSAVSCTILNRFPLTQHPFKSFFSSLGCDFTLPSWHWHYSTNSFHFNSSLCISTVAFQQFFVISGMN